MTREIDREKVIADAIRRFEDGEIAAEDVRSIERWLATNPKKAPQILRFREQPHD